jgi:3-oxoacyl-[acyl-carrier protein] reductase
MTASQRFFITGCASGIGRHAADVLLAAGHAVFATDLRIEPLRDFAQARAWPAARAFCRALDVRDPAAWAAAYAEAEQKMGAVDVLLNVAGYLKPAYVADAADADVDMHFDVNTKGVVHGTRVAARRMVARGRGHIVNIASLAALAPVPGIALYSASKYAVRAFSLAAAQELRPHGVYVSVVCPDAVRTPMLDLQLDYREAELTFSGSRVFTPDDIVRVLIDDVLPRRPLQVSLPRSRALLARFADLFPRTSLWIEPLIRRVGRSRQARMRGAA